MIFKGEMDIVRRSDARAVDDPSSAISFPRQQVSAPRGASRRLRDLEPNAEATEDSRANLSRSEMQTTPREITRAGLIRQEYLREELRQPRRK